jgi:hypothetical protein
VPPSSPRHRQPPHSDIDAGYTDPHTIYALVADMAADYDLAPEWLNTNV